MRQDIPLPLYYKVKEDIIKKIENEKYKVNDSLPSEKGLMDIYGVSRTTIRQAVDILVNDGYLERRRGLGTFVAEPKIHLWELEELRNFADEVSRQGYIPSTKVLSIEKIQAPKHVEDVFGEGPIEVFKLERLRYVNKNPSIYVITYIPYILANTLDQENFEKDSLFKILEEKYKVLIGYAEKRLKAVNATVEESKLLKIKAFSAIQLVETITYNKDSEPIEYSISKDRGDVSEFCVRLQYK